MHLTFNPAYLLKPRISLQYSNQTPSQKAYFHFIKIMPFDFIQMNQGNNKFQTCFPIALSTKVDKYIILIIVKLHFSVEINVPALHGRR